MSNIHKITKKEIENLLSSRFDDLLSLKDLPHPSTFKDMDKSVSRIANAIKNNEKITLVGDYDVDGVISTSLVIKFFEELGIKLKWIIPNRFTDGYGLSVSLMPKIEDSDLIITVDNGISALQAAQECKENGIDLIITDHHIVPEPAPDSYATVNQKQLDCNFEYHDICGAQIAWYLCSALNRELNSNIDMKRYLSMVSIAIIADIMPLIHINRAMVKSGLKLLSNSTLPFVLAYREYRQNNSFTSEDIAFGLAPLLNSAGRLEDASLAVRYITATRIDEATALLLELIALNESRKNIEQEITLEAINQVRNEEKIIVVSSGNWHEGVVGIVASKLKDKFDKPAIVLNCSNGICKGSGRSIDGCDLFRLVGSCREMLEKFGGHKAAIGMSINQNNIAKFIEIINSNYDDYYLEPIGLDDTVMGELSFVDIDFELVNIIERFEPYGEANKRPKFVTNHVKILAVKTMGKDKNHLRFTFENDSVVHEGVQFNTFEKYEVGDIVSIVYKISVNHFRGESNIQLMIESITITSSS